jgi:hypothetical protein
MFYYFSGDDSSLPDAGTKSQITGAATQFLGSQQGGALAGPGRGFMEP